MATSQNSNRAHVGAPSRRERRLRVLAPLTDAEIELLLGARVRDPGRR